jgi:hypothetical protein
LSAAGRRDNSGTTNAPVRRQPRRSRRRTAVVRTSNVQHWWCTAAILPCPGAGIVAGRVVPSRPLLDDSGLLVARAERLRREVDLRQSEPRTIPGSRAAPSDCTAAVHLHADTTWQNSHNLLQLNTSESKSSSDVCTLPRSPQGGEVACLTTERFRPWVERTQSRRTHDRWREIPGRPLRSVLIS